MRFYFFLSAGISGLSLCILAGCDEASKKKDDHSNAATDEIDSQGESSSEKSSNSKSDESLALNYETAFYHESQFTHLNRL